jgi:hypothetical protein
MIRRVQHNAIEGFESPQLHVRRAQKCPSDSLQVLSPQIPFERRDSSVTSQLEHNLSGNSGEYVGVQRRGEQLVA